MDFQALVITALLTLGSTGVFGNSRELSTTAGDTVHIPCLFGEGTIRNIYWYYNDGTGPIKILTFFKGTVTVDAIYAYRATLHHDNSTLILSGITVNDEGTYRCDVDREGQTAVPNINTKLNVFSLTPDTLPEIAECTNIDCIIYSNKSITITCALRNVYPVEDAKLIWYQGGQLVTSPNDLTLNDDGTIDMIRPIQVSESGNLTCNASFLTAQGAENAAVSVAVWITPESENTPGKKLTSGQTAGIVVCALAVPLVIMVIAYLIVQKRRKKKNDTALKESGRKKKNDTALKESGRKKKNDTALKESEQQTMDSDEHVKETDHLITRGRSDVVEQPKLTLLAKKIPVGKFHEFCFQLDWEYNDANQVLIKHSNDYEKAFLEIIMEWKTHTGGHRSVLQKALQEAGVGGLLHLIAGAKTETHPVQETTNNAGPKEEQSSLIQGQDERRESPSQNGNPENNQGDRTAEKVPEDEAKLVRETASLIAGNGSRNGESYTSANDENRSRDGEEQGESRKQANNANTQHDPESIPLMEENGSRNGEGRTSATSNYQVVSEEQLELLSVNFPDAKYTKLSIKLGSSFNNSKTVLTKHGNDAQKAVLEVLMAWKTRTGGYRPDLIAALKASDAGGLVGMISDEVDSASQKQP